MSTEYALKLDSEKIREMPMVDLAFEVLKAANTPFYYRDLMMEIAKHRGYSEAKVNEVIAQVYTEINIDGRFACVGNNVWGLKRWYAVERSEDPVASGAKRPRIINDDDDDLDDEDLFGEGEEETFTPDVENYDLFDENREELFDEGEETAEEGEEVVMEDDEESPIDEELDEDDEEADVDDFDGDDEDADDDADEEDK